MMSSKRQLFNLGLMKDLPECNIALIGDLGVGKSALTVKYLTKRFIMEYDPHLEDIYQRTESIDGQEIMVRIMDTCDTIGKSAERYLKWAHGIIVVYSITNRTSFESAKKHIENLSQFEKEANKDIPVILVGNKIDLERYRTIRKTTGQELASQYDYIFHETSAAEDYESVEELFKLIIREVTRSNERQMSMQALFISEDNKVGLLNPLSQGLGSRNLRRTKSPGTSDIKDVQGNRSQEKDNRFAQRRMPSTFKMFKSRFNIFN